MLGGQDADSLSYTAVYIIAFIPIVTCQEKIREKTDRSDQPFSSNKIKSSAGLPVCTLHSVVGNDLSEPDTFILQGQREVHERKHKEGNTPNFQHELNVWSDTVSPAHSVHPAEILN